MTRALPWFSCGPCKTVGLLKKDKTRLQLKEDSNLRESSTCLKTKRGK
jgi:hypothetical protein